MPNPLGNPMNIALCLDSNFLPYCSTTIQSIIENHWSKDRINFFIIYAFDSKLLTPILTQISHAEHHATCLTVSSFRLKGLRNRAHFTEANYLRLTLKDQVRANHPHVSKYLLILHQYLSCLEISQVSYLNRYNPILSISY